MDTTTPGQDRIKDAGIKILAVIGLMTVLAFAAWGTIAAANRMPGMFSNLTAAVATITSQFFPATTTPGELTLTMATLDAVAGEPFVFSWRNGASETYTFTYECRDGFSFDVPGQNRDAAIVCGSPFTFSTATHTLTLIPRSERNRFLDVPVTLASAEEDAIGSTLVTVINESIADSRNSLRTDGDTETAVEIPAAPRTETEIFGTGTGIAADPNGTADLMGYVIAVGYIDEDTLQFIATSTINRDATAAVRFGVRNIGTQASGEWSFEADLPTSPSHTYEPRTDQRSLAPGERIEYTLSFDRLRHAAKKGMVRVTIDHDEDLSEFTRVNNKIDATFSIVD